MPTKDSLRNEIAGLLRRVPDTWETFELDQLSETEAEAFFLLIGAGMVERRFDLRLRMLNHPLGMAAQATATGEGGLTEALDRLAAGAWHDWRESYAQWKQCDTRDSVPFACERIDKDEWRLTSEGVLARGDLSNGRVDTVLDYVLKRGFFAGRHPCVGSGRLLRFHRVPADSLISNSGAPVQVVNCQELGTAMFLAFQRASQNEQQPAAGARLKSGLPDGPGSGAIVNDMIAEYIEQRKQQYGRFVLEALAEQDGGVERFAGMFGPRAIARHWLADWTKKLQTEIDDVEQRREMIDKEENRVAGAIKRQPQYKQRIHPPLHGRRPTDWEPPPTYGQPLHASIDDILHQGPPS